MATPLSKISESLDSNLYEKDYYLWLKDTANLLREKNLAELDLPHLIEEIEDMGKREKRSLYSNLKILPMHLLKYRYQPEKRSNSWRYYLLLIERRMALRLVGSLYCWLNCYRYYFGGRFIDCHQSPKLLFSILF
jgi:hypothetical protein